MMYTRILIYFFPCMLILFGCTPLHQSHVDELLPEPPVNFAESPSSNGEKTKNTWWQSLQSPQLNALIAKAFEESPDLDRFFARMQQQKALVQTAQSAHTLQANLGAAATREKQMSLFSSSTGTTMNASVAASYELDLWNRLENSSKAAHFFSQASKEDLRTAYLILSARIADMYVKYVEQNKQLRIAKKRKEIATTRLQLTEKRYLTGIAAAEDIYLARQAHATALRELYTSKTAVAESVHELAVLTATFPSDFYLLPLEDLPLQPDLPQIGLPADLLLMRPDLRRAFFVVHARDAQVAGAIAAQFPTLNLSAAVGGTGLEFGPVSASGAIWKLAMQAAMPLLNGGRIDADIDRNKAVLQEELALFRSALFTAVKEVENGLARFRESSLFLHETSTDLENVLASYALIKERHESGLVGALDYLNGQDMLARAQSRLLSAKRAHLSAYITLVRSLGGSWPDAFIHTRERASKNETIQ